MEKDECGSNFYMLTAQVLNDKNLNHAAKITISILYGLSRESGKCWASNEWLCDKLDIKETALRTILQDLEKNNYIKRELHTCVNNPFKKYRIILVQNNFKLSLPASENRGSGGPENRGCDPRKTEGIIYKKELIDKKEVPAPSAPCSHPEAGNVSLLFSEAIKKTKPDIKEPAFTSTQKIFDKLLRIDKRKIEIIKKLIEWLPTHNFWSTKILSAESFRRNFDKLELEMNQNRSKQCLNDPGLINKIKEHVHSIPSHKVIVGQNYVEFPEFRDAYFKVGDPRFKENISHHFYKIGYPLEEDK